MKNETKYKILFYISLSSILAIILYIGILIYNSKEFGIGIALGIFFTFIVEINLMFVLYLYLKSKGIRKAIERE